MRGIAPKQPVEQLPECLWWIALPLVDDADADEPEDMPDVPDVDEPLEQFDRLDIPGKYKPRLRRLLLQKT